MNDDDLKAAFRSLDRVQPSADFMQAARTIPLRHPRDSGFSLWRLFGLPTRLAALSLSAICGLGVGYLTLDDDSGDPELSAFLDLGEDDTGLSDDTSNSAMDAEWDAP